MLLDPDLRHWLILIAANIPLYLVVGKVFFGSWAEFFDTLRFWLTPDIVSAWRGDYWADNWAELKLFVFMALCAGAVYSEHRYFFS